ncbi:hypothetical protein [Capnocytophaga canis]|nr:hypothetical protein [Capnocytophaga canis]
MENNPKQRFGIQNKKEFLIMGIFKPDKKRLEQIDKGMEESTRNFLTPLLEKSLGKHLKKFVMWANNNRKKMFIINISFLSLLVCYSIFRAFTAKTDFESVSNVSNRANSIYTEKNNRLEKQFDNLFKMYDLKYELEELTSKDSLTKKDSIRIEELYNQIFKNEEEN